MRQVIGPLVGVGLGLAWAVAGACSASGGAGAGGTTQTSTGASGGAAGEGGSGGEAGGSGGEAGTGGQGATGGEAGTGGGSDCPEISCTTSCPGETWLDVDGCPSCACAADLELTVSSQARPAKYVTVSVEASEYIGGIDRWVFELLWQYDDPNASDEAEDVAVTVRLMRLGPEVEPDETNVTYFMPEDAGNPLEVLPGKYTLHGFALLTADLAPVGGFFSIRRVGGLFEGHVSLDFDVDGDFPQSVHVATPFAVPVP